MQWDITQGMQLMLWGASCCCYYCMCGLFLIFKIRLWLIRGVGTAWTDEESDYNYKRFWGWSSQRCWLLPMQPSGVSMVVKYDYARSRLDLLVFFFFFSYRIQMPWMWLIILPESYFLSCLFHEHLEYSRKKNSFFLYSPESMTRQDT